jgi:hypothetical protein
MNMTENSGADNLGLQSTFTIVSLNLDTLTRNDNGVEYQIIVTNRFGQNSAITRLNVTCNPHPNIL